MAKVIKLDEANRRIGLSIKAYKEEVGETEQDEETESTGHEAEVPQAQTEAESSEDKPAQEA